MFKSLVLTSIAIGISAATMSLPAQAKWPTSNQADIRDHRQQSDIRDHRKKRHVRDHRSKSRKQVRDHRRRNRVQNHRRPHRSNEKIYAQHGNKWGQRGGFYDNRNHQHPPLMTCKRAMSSSAYDRTRALGQRRAVRIWQRNAKNRYGSPVRWGAAKNKRITCRFNRSQASFKCKATANPCFAGNPQNRQ